MRWSHTFTTVDVHVAGQALRLITHGVPRLRATGIREQAAEMQERHDHIRRWLLAEPRGHGGLNGALLVPTRTPDVDYGVIFMSNAGYGTLSGHGVIALATALIETGAVPVDGPEARITFETVAGVVQARTTIDQGRARTVRFRNVPAFRLVAGLGIEVAGRPLRVDVAYGGAWYAIVQAEEAGVELVPAATRQLARLGVDVLHATANALDVVHPQDPALAGLYGTIFLGAPRSDDATRRTVAVYGDGHIDRSPSGTGISAAMACLAADGQLGVGETFVGESIVDTVLTGRPVVAQAVGEYPGIITEIAGRGAVTGLHTFVIDPTDPLADPFVL